MSSTAGLPLPPIVVADGGEAAPLLRGTLPARFPLTAATTTAQAHGLIHPDTPLVLCDPHFDDGRMYDLLRWIKARPDLKGVRFLAVRVREGELDDAMYESVKIATEALGADGFVDLFRWQVKYGPQAAAQRLAERVQAMALGAPGFGDTA